MPVARSTMLNVSTRVRRPALMGYRQRPSLFRPGSHFKNGADVSEIPRSPRVQSWNWSALSARSMHLYISCLSVSPRHSRMQISPKGAQILSGFSIFMERIAWGKTVHSFLPRQHNSNSRVYSGKRSMNSGGAFFRSFRTRLSVLSSSLASPVTPPTPGANCLR